MGSSFPYGLDIDSFRRPDGSIDYAQIPDPRIAMKIKAEVEGLPHDRSLRDRRPVVSHGDSTEARSRPVPTSIAEAFSGAPVAETVADLGRDSSAEPVPEDEALQRLAEMRGTAKPNVNAEGVRLPPAELPEPRMLGAFDPDAPENRLPGQAPPARAIASSTGFGKLGRPKPGTGAVVEQDQLSNPFPSRAQAQADQPTPAGDDSGVPKRPWTPDRLGLSLEETRNNKRVIDPEFDEPAPKPGVLSQLWGGLKDELQNPSPTWSRLSKQVFGGGAAPEPPSPSLADPIDDQGFHARPTRAHGQPIQPSKPVAALEQYRKSRGLETGGGASPAPERPQFAELPTGDQPASPRQPLKAAMQLGMGATPPDAGQADKEWEDAKKSRDEQLLMAQIASQFGHYADVASGSGNTGDRGAALREQAGNPMEDLKTRRGERQAADDRAFEREGVLQQRGALGVKTQREAEFNDPASQKSSQARSIAVSLYPKLVARIPPAEFKKMSAADVEMFLKEAAPERMGKAGAGAGGGMNPAQLNQVRNKIPANLKDTYDALARANEAIDRIGGWEAMKVGGLGGLTPTMLLDADQAEVRQTLAGVAQAFLSSGAGKSITKQEREILLGMSGADSEKFMTNPAVFKRGMAIIEHRMQNSARQALAGVGEEDQDKLLGPETGMDVSKDWIRGRADRVAPKPGVQPQAGAGEEMIWVTKGGQLGKIPKSKFNPQKHQLAEAP